MAVVYFHVSKPARTTFGSLVEPGNYYITDMGGFTTSADVYSVALAISLKDKVTSMWMQYGDNTVVDLLTGKNLDAKSEELSDFAQAKLTAVNWRAKGTSYPSKSTRRFLMDPTGEK